MPLTPCTIDLVETFGLLLSLSSFPPSEVTLLSLVVILIQISVDQGLQACCTIWCCAKPLPTAHESRLACVAHGGCHLHSLPPSLTLAQKTEVASLVAAI